MQCRSHIVRRGAGRGHIWPCGYLPQSRTYVYSAGRGGAYLRRLCASSAQCSPIVGSQGRPKRIPLGSGSPHRVRPLGFLSLYQPRIGESGCEPVGSTRTSSARGNASGRVARRIPFHSLVEEKVARLGGADGILRAAKVGLHLRLVHQGHVNVVETDPVLVRAH